MQLILRAGDVPCKNELSSCHCENNFVPTRRVYNGSSPAMKFTLRRTMPINIHTIKASVLKFRRCYYYKLFSNYPRMYTKPGNRTAVIFCENDRVRGVIQARVACRAARGVLIIHNTRSRMRLLARRRFVFECT